MAKITKFIGNMRAFAADALSGERTKFADETTSDDLNDLITPQYFRGWAIGTNPDGYPPMEFFNAAHYITTQALSYLYQQGVPEWSEGQEYHNNSIIKGSNGVLYKSNEDNNTGFDPLTDAQKWSAIIPETTAQVAYFATATPPAGWLKCDGTAVSRMDYANLFAAIGTTYGDGDGVNTFNLPDLRGEFVRGLDDGRGVDAGRTLGSSQLDEIKRHAHSFMGSNGGTVTPGTGEVAYHNNVALETHETGGDETRPRNIALLACIRY